MNIIQIIIDDIYNASNREDLFTMYSNESKGKGLPNVNPDWDMYKTLESLGMLDTIGVYKDKLLVGFATVITNKMPHYSTYASTVESIFVLKEYRKYGAGKKLIEKVEEVVKKKGAKQLFLSAPYHGVLNRVAGSFGFNKTNVVYTRHLV